MCVFNQMGIGKAVLSVCLSMQLLACGGSGGNDDDVIVFVQSVPASEQRVIPAEESRAFRADSPYASVLKKCTLVDAIEDICPLSELPYLGQMDGPVSIEAIMDRVVVTHDWMGVRFEQMLRRLPADIVQLFGPVTSVVIGSTVRPSDFSTWSGRIRLDPRNFWLSVPEKSTIEVAPDFRTDFGAGLKFRSPWRLALDNAYASAFFSLTDDSEREIGDLDINLASLLYHELAHANDFVQSESLDTLPMDITPLQAADLLTDTAVWRQLYERADLTAQRSFLYGLARVRWRDEEPDDFQSSVLADDAGSYFGNEGKIMFYGYSNQVEDVATLFEAAMMSYHYGVDYHVGFTNKPENEDEAGCNDYKVAWGVRNRLASPLVAPRAELVVNRLLGQSAELDQFFASGLGSEESLRIGAGWCESVSRDPVLAKQSKSDNRPLMELGPR